LTNRKRNATVRLTTYLITIKRRLIDYLHQLFESVTGLLFSGSEKPPIRTKRSIAANQIPAGTQKRNPATKFNPEQWSNKIGWASFGQYLCMGYFL